MNSAIDSVSFYQKQKEIKIQGIVDEIKANKSKQKALILNEMLYYECLVYDSDMAIYIANSSIDIAKDLDLDGEYAKWMINKAFIYSATGLLKESYDLLKSIENIPVNREVKLNYFIQMEYYYSHIIQYSKDNEYLSEEYSKELKNYSDSIFQITIPEDRQYLINRAWRNLSSDSTTFYMQKLKDRLHSTTLDNRFSAIDAYTIAHTYSANDDNDNFVYYLIQSAIADIKSCNKDIASLQELCDVLQKEVYLEDVFRYTTYCLNVANEFKNRIRVMELSSILDSTYKSLLDKTTAQSKRLGQYLFFSIFMLVLVAFLVYNIYYKNKKLVSSQEKLSEANALLEKHNKELTLAHKELCHFNVKLEAINKSLTESNYIKESYIVNSFIICSSQIAWMEETFSKIFKMIRFNKIEELQFYCSDPQIVNEQLKELYQSFDNTFLQIYPNFVAQFNDLLRENRKVKIREGELLNTELRIYALIRLGINDNIKISSILHCSIQTVYNNRQKTRNRTDLSNKELIASIMNIGNGDDNNKS